MIGTCYCAPVVVLPPRSAKQASTVAPFSSVIEPWSMFAGMLRRRVSIALGGLVFGVAGACASPGASNDAGAHTASDVGRAEAMLATDAPLPPRADVVALSYTVAALAAREGKSEEGARLARLSADLRLRLFRLERVDGDATGAAELFATAARSAPGSEAGCQAEAARARLMGELGASAGTSYREIYLARRRQTALVKAADKSECVAALDRDLAMLDAFRPTDREMASLTSEGDKAADLASRGEGPSGLPQPASPGAPIGSSSASAGPSLQPNDVVVSPPDVPASAGPVKLTSIDKFASEGGGRVVINLTGPAAFHVGALAAEGGKDARIFVDIDKATSKGVARELVVGGAVRRVRTGARDNGGTRVVLDLEEDMHRKVFYLPEPFRIVVDVSSRPPEAAPAAGAGALRSVKRVVIDPGHGGDDAGAVGPTGLREKDVTLDIAHRVAPLLSHELSIETLLTRDSDTFIPLDERTARANAFHADLFVSIHCNASENGEARGVESFVLDELKEVTRASARVAALENGISLKSGAKTLDPQAMDAEMSRIFQGLASGETGARSRTFGGLLQRSVLSSLSQRYSDTKEHGVKSAGFYVLFGAEMPAVLFETSFISNPVDESRLATADYRQKLADAIVNAIKAYREGR